MQRRELFALFAGAALIGCGGGDNLGGAPTDVEMVTSGGFEDPMDAVATPDGATFYFSAHTTPADPADSVPAIFSVPSAGGAAQIVHEGAPLADPTGLLMNCDGTRLYVADLGFAEGDADPALDGDTAPIYTIDLATETLTPLAASGIGEATSLAFTSDCSNLYATGYTADGAPALFKMSPDGGVATVVKSGAPLISPSGVYVDTDLVAWVMDHQPENAVGGALFAITDDGATTPVIEGLRISEPAGVSLTAQGRIAVIPSRDADGNGQLITVDIDTNAMTVVEAPQMLEPAGIRTATEASVMAVVDNDGDAIFRAQ